MSEVYATITVAEKQMTSELISEILWDEFSDTSIEHIVKYLHDRNARAKEEGKPERPIPTTVLEQYKEYNHYNDGIFHFHGEMTTDSHDTEPVCVLLRKAGVTYEFNACYDEDNADEVIWSPDEGSITYDVCRSGRSTISHKVIEEIMACPTDREKVEAFEAYARKFSPYGRTTPSTIAKQNQNSLAKIDEILSMLDAGAISQLDAFEQIKLAKEA